MKLNIALVILGICSIHSLKAQSNTDTTQRVHILQRAPMIRNEGESSQHMAVPIGKAPTPPEQKNPATGGDNKTQPTPVNNQPADKPKQ